MTTPPMDSGLVRKAIDFHGHWCPGLAIGVRAAQWALQEMGKAPDEEIVAVVETDMCGVDAIQALMGCTFGKGNFIHKDYGKTAFAFYRRRDGKSARLVFNPATYADIGQEMSRLHRIDEKQGVRFTLDGKPALVAVACEWGERVNTSEGKKTHLKAPSH